MTTEKASVTTVSDTVGSSRCPISDRTGLSEKIETPRSPCSSANAQCMNCTGNGSSRPSRARIAAMFAGRRIVAGDDGRRIARREMQQQEHDQPDDSHDHASEASRRTT